MDCWLFRMRGSAPCCGCQAGAAGLLMLMPLKSKLTNHMKLWWESVWPQRGTGKGIELKNQGLTNPAAWADKACPISHQTVWHLTVAVPHVTYKACSMLALGSCQFVQLPVFLGEPPGLPNPPPASLYLSLTLSPLSNLSLAFSLPHTLPLTSPLSSCATTTSTASSFSPSSFGCPLPPQLPSTVFLLPLSLILTTPQQLSSNTESKHQTPHVVGPQACHISQGPSSSYHDK